jgi:vacuolar-type H+-ATPase subunit E/Vma4
MSSKVLGLNELILKLQDEGIAKANEESQKIIDNANKTANQIITDAEEKAAAQKDAFEKTRMRQRQELDDEMTMAARDFMLNFSNNIQSFVIRPHVKKDIEEIILDTKFLKNCLKGIFQEVLIKEESDILVILNEKTKNEMIEFFGGKMFKSMSAKGKINFAFTNKFTGFQIIKRDEKLIWDFTLDTLAQEIGKLVEPNLLKYFIQKNI